MRDLNTANGTYVNDKIIQNSYIQLVPGDIIRFDFDGIAFQFDTDDTLANLALSVSKRILRIIRLSYDYSFLAMIYTS